MDGLPLFPLHTVLFPGGELRLRIFEPRYLTMVRDCTRDGLPFGVCLILEGREAGEPATPAAFGTTARIVDFHVDERGLLGIVARGERRFHVQRTRVRDSGLVVGEVGLLDDAPATVRPEHGLLVTLLERIIEQAGGPHAKAGPADYDDAHWLGWRLAELLPLDDRLRQRLLQSDDPHARLQQLLEVLPDLG
jgi:uncharacterized protein